MEMTWADRLRETGRLEGLETGRLEGLETGRREGREAGRVEGDRDGLSRGRSQGAAVARHLLLELVTSRFGEPPAALRSRFESLEDLAEIAAWSERVLQASELAELDFEDPAGP